MTPRSNSPFSKQTVEELAWHSLLPLARREVVDSASGRGCVRSTWRRRGAAGLGLLNGYTLLGNLLALLDREEVPETQKHFVRRGTER
jgi:hypothetical protein